MRNGSYLSSWSDAGGRPLLRPLTGVIWVGVVGTKEGETVGLRVGRRWAELVDEETAAAAVKTCC